jgi:hypothetical protein
VGPNDSGRVWTAIAAAARDAPVSVVRDRAPYGVVCGVEITLTINDRTAPVATAWHYADEDAAPRLVTDPSTQHGAMAVVREITAFDRVELLEPVEGTPAGARGGVLELRDGNVAMVEITTPALDPAARILFVPLGKLRRVD